MSVKIDSSIFGDKELRDAFNNAFKFISEEMADALDKAGLVLTGHAKTFAPIKTGALRGSIHKEGPEITHNNIKVVVGTNLVYAPFQEFGTSRGIRAKRYFARAREATKTALPGFLKDSLGKVVAKLAK